MARPSSLTPEVHAAIVASVRKGNFRTTAAAAAGVHRNSLYNWIERGEREDAEEPYASFAHDLMVASATSQMRLVRRILAAVDVKKASHLINMLERRHREWSMSISQHKRDTEDAILAKLRAHPKLHAEVANVLSAQEDSVAGAHPH